MTEAAKPKREALPKFRDVVRRMLATPPAPKPKKAKRKASKAAK